MSAIAAAALLLMNSPHHVYQVHRPAPQFPIVTIVDMDPNGPEPLKTIKKIPIDKNLQLLICILPPNEGVHRMMVPTEYE